MSQLDRAPGSEVVGHGGVGQVSPYIVKQATRPPIVVPLRTSSRNALKNCVEARVAKCKDGHLAENLGARFFECLSHDEHLLFLAELA